MQTLPSVKYAITGQDLVLDKEKRYILRVRDLAEEDKPREKLIENGPAALSSSELLAIILNTGTKKEDVLNMTSRILKEYGEKMIAGETDPKKLEKESLIPLVKACQIVACFELGRRFFKENKKGKITIRTARQAFEYLKDMGDLPKEHLRGIYLNSRHVIIHDEIISVGSLTSNIVHPREVFKPAIEHSAAAMIIAHNHPSGNTKPTQSDIEITRQLIQAGNIIGISLLDHLIIAGGRFSSVPADYDIL